MVMLGRSVHLTKTIFLGKLDKAVNQYFVHILSLVNDNNPCPCEIVDGKENDHGTYFMINLRKSLGMGRG